MTDKEKESNKRNFRLFFYSGLLLVVIGIVSFGLFASGMENLITFALGLSCPVFGFFTLLISLNFKPEWLE